MSPYAGGEFHVVPVAEGVADGSVGPDLARAFDAEFPIHWPADATRICLERCFVIGGIAQHLVPVAEDDVPSWLWRHEPEGAATAPRSETSLCQVIDRMAGSWSYHGWKAGYFDSEDDARIFYDECRWLLFHRRISPAIKQWRCAGRYWAYGHDMSVPSTYLTDCRTGAVRRAAATDLPPFDLVINAANGALTGEAGMWDLWRRESEILTHGGHCGVNISGEWPDGSAEGVTRIDDVLAVGDAMARSVTGGAENGRSRRRLTVDGDRPDSCAIAGRAMRKLAETDVDAIGTALARRHVQAILDARTHPGAQRSRKNRSDAGLRLALQSARQALLPEHLIRRTLELADTGWARTADDVLGGEAPDAVAQPACRADDPVTVVRVDDSPANRLVDLVAISAWSGAESGFHFRTAADTWNTCPGSGPVRSASGDGSFMFLDDTASDPWFVNAAAYVGDRGAVDIAGYQHAAELLTVAADVCLMTTTAITPRLARRIWDFRPLALSPASLGQCLMAAGVAYDSGAGRTLCASLCALLTGTAYRVSAQMAGEMGRFPEHAKNAPDMLRVLDRHGDMVANCAHESSPPGLVEAVEECWSEAQRLGALEGFRNAQVSAVCDTGELTALLGGDGAGLYPMASLVGYRRTPAGYWEMRLDAAVTQGLRALGYDESQVADIVRHVVGHGTLAHAPGVNHETLRKRGFTQTAIDAVETALSNADDISSAFNPCVLGADYCRHILGFAGTELHEDGFDMLAALGFSDAGIEAANIYCCGAHTLEGAPHLAPGHLAVFDCAESQGARGARCVPPGSIVRMMAAVQPHISGAIGQVLPVVAATPDVYRKVLAQASQLKLKSITLRRRASGRPVVASAPLRAPQDDRGSASLSLIGGGPGAALPDPDSGVPSHNHSRTDVADGAENTADVTKASRHASSHPARSTASVPSSADAVSSNGMFDVASP